MRWHDERIAEEVDTVWCRDGELYGANVMPLMQSMRDDYEQASLNQRAETIALAQRVAELEYACDIGRETITAKDARVAELQAQLAAALATTERAVVAPEADTGALYAEGCAP